MDKYPDFWSVVLGNQPPGFFIGYMFLGLMSAVGMILVMATQRYKAAEDTPDKWSWKYFWADNLGKVIAGIFLIPIFVRLLLELNLKSVSMVFVSIGVGFGFFGLAKIATNFGLWTTKKLSKGIADKLNEKESDK